MTETLISLLWSVVQTASGLTHPGRTCEAPSQLRRGVAQSCATAIPWTLAYQASPSMEFSRQEYWSGLSFPSPGDPPDLGI